MPMGLAIMKWDEKAGIELLCSYPEQIKVDDKMVMQIYSQHEYSGDPGMVTLSAGSVNIASYYTGKESKAYLVLILSLEEDGDIFEEGLAELSQQVAENLDINILKPILPSLLQRLSVFPTLSEEQRLANTYQNEPKRMILSRLREEGAVLRSELDIWMRDQYKKGFVNMNNTVADMMKLGLIKSASIKGMSSDVIFMVSDILAMKRPPAALIQNPVEHHLPEPFLSSYKNDLKHFFQHYQIDEIDNLEVINRVILNSAAYEALKLLREAIVTRNDLEKLKRKGLDNVDETLKVLWAAKMISVYRDDKDIEYFCLISDYLLEKIYPKHHLDVIRKAYMNKSQNFNVLIKALDFLEEEYVLMNSVPKPKKKKDIK